MKNLNKLTKKELIEIVKRFINDDERKKITSPENAVPYLRGLISEAEKQEHLITIFLDSANKVIETKIIFIGTLNSCIVHPREIFKKAVELSASYIIMAHNHPSGNIEPSNEDILTTDKIRKAGEIMGIELLDHIIFSNQTAKIKSLNLAGFL